MAKVGELTPEERRRRLAELRSRQQNLEAFRQVKDVQDVAADVTVPTVESVNVDVDRALAGQDMGLLALLNKEQAIPEREVTERRVDYARRTGALSRKPAGAELSRDIEGALARGGKEVVGGDRRVVVTPDTSATGMATRDEAPSLWEHAKAFAVGENNQASGVGLLFNALDAMSRGSATGLNYLMHGRAAGADPRNLPKDIAGAVAGTEGASGSVGSGGMVSKRGSGMGDYFRKQVMLAQEGKIPVQSSGAEPTARDFWRQSKWLSPHRALDPLDLLDMPGIGDKVMEVFWEHGYLPTKSGISQVGDAVRGKMAEWQGVDPSLVEPTARPDQKAELKRMIAENLDKPLSQVDPNDPIFDVVGSVAAMATDPLSWVNPGEHVPQMLRAAGAAKVANKLEFDITKALSKEGRLARGLKAVEGAEDASHIARQVNAAESSAGAQSAIETGEQVNLLTKAASEMHKADVPLVKELLQNGPNMLRSRQPQEIMADIVNAPRAGLSTNDIGIIDDAINGNIDRLFHERFALAQKLDIPVSAPHPWASGTPAQRRALAAATLLDRQRGRELASGQRMGRLSDNLLTQEGNIPRPPRADVPVAMERAGVPKPIVGAVERFGAPFFKKPSYDPYARRAMVSTHDLQSLRNEAADLINQGAIPDPLEVKALQDFIYNKGSQGQQTRDWVRNVVVSRGGQNIERPLGTLDEAERIAAERTKRYGSTGGQVSFVSDPVQAAMARRQVTGSAELFHNMAEGVRGVKDLSGAPVVQRLDDFLVRPRKGVVPNDVIRDLQRFARGTGPRDLTEAVIGSAGIQQSLENALERQGLVLIGGKHGELSKIMPTLNGHVMPRAIYDDLVELAPKLNPGMAGRVGDVIFRAMSAFVPILLNTPGFHARNTFFGLFQAHLATSAKDMVDPRLWNLAAVVAHAAEKGGLVDGVVTIGGKQVRIADLVEETRRLGVFEGGRLADLEGRWRGGIAPYKDQRVSKFLEGINPFNMNRGALGLTDEPLAKIVAGRGPALAMGLATEPIGKLFGGKMRGPGAALTGAATAENVLRTFVYLAKRRKGWTEAAASGQVMKFMFDYTGMNLTRVEKNIRKLIPFYQWLKQSSLLTIDQMMKQPGKYAGWNRIYQALNSAGRDRNTDPRFIPQSVLRTGAIASPFSEDTPEQNRMIRMERPGAQVMNPEEWAAQLHPGAQVAYELGSGRYLFGDTPISKGPNPINQPAWWPFPQVNPEDLAQYAAGKAGFPGYVAQMLLAQVNPEWQRTNARHTGVDDQDRMMNRATSALIGPSPVQVDPAAVKRNAYQGVAKAREDAHTQAQELEKRRHKGRPFNFTDDEVLP